MDIKEVKNDVVIKVPLNKVDHFMWTMYEHLVDSLSKAIGNEMNPEKLVEIRALAKAKTEDFMAQQIASQAASTAISKMEPQDAP